MAGTVTMSLLQCDARKDTAGTVAFFECRAWAVFNTVTTTTLIAGGNIGSLVDNGTGDTTINFTNAMPDANYAVTLGAKVDSTAAGSEGYSAVVRRTTSNPSASSLRVAGQATTTGALTDLEQVHVAIHR